MINKLLLSLVILVVASACNEGPVPPKPKTNQEIFAESLNKMVTQKCYKLYTQEIAASTAEKSSKNCTEEEIGSLVKHSAATLEECSKGLKDEELNARINVLFPKGAEVSLKCLEIFKK